MRTIMRRNGNTVPARPATTWVDQLLQDNLSNFFNDFPVLGTGANNSVVPVNLRETDKTYEMEIMAPGLKKEDLKIQATNDLLTVSYEHETRDEEKSDNGDVIRQEYSMQSWSRSFTLDDTVDVNKVVAGYENGVLKLTLPKKEHAQKVSKTIEVK